MQNMNEQVLEFYSTSAAKLVVILMYSGELLFFSSSVNIFWTIIVALTLTRPKNQEQNKQKLSI